MEEGGVVENLDRIASALEKLASDPQVEIEFGEPICPHCGQFDPEIQTSETEGRGKLSEFIIAARCCSCGQPLFSVIESYSMHQTFETAKKDIETRRAVLQSNGQ